MRVMDFGAGTGLIAGHIAPRVAKVIAVDISPSMLEALAAKPELRGKVEPRCQDIMETPLEGTVDAIVSAMALHHVEDTAALVTRFADALEPGGFLALADLDREDGSFHAPGTEGVYHAGFDRAELGGIFERSGFEAIRFTTALDVRKDGGAIYPVFFMTARKRAQAASIS